jgi:hypothetical protein
VAVCANGDDSVATVSPFGSVVVWVFGYGTLTEVCSDLLLFSREKALSLFAGLVKRNRADILITLN